MRTGDKKKVDFRELLERLHDPVQLRVVITGLMLVVGYVGIYMPLSSRIEETTRKLGWQYKRQALAKEIEFLRTQLGEFQDRLPENTDANQWAQYVIDGIRKFPLKLLTLEPQDPTSVGPYTAVGLKIGLEGKIGDLDSLLCWLETNKRLFRIDSVEIAPTRGGNDVLVMQFTLLGMKT